MGLFLQRPLYFGLLLFNWQVDCAVRRGYRVLVTSWLVGCTELHRAKRSLSRALIAVPDSGCRSGRQMQAGRCACDVSHLSFLLIISAFSNSGL